MLYMIQAKVGTLLFKESHDKLKKKTGKAFGATEISCVMLGNTLSLVFECRSTDLEQARKFVTKNPFSLHGEYEFRYREGKKLIREKFSA